MVLVCNWDDPSSADVDHLEVFSVTSLLLRFIYYTTGCPGCHEHRFIMRFNITHYHMGTQS
jgi:hypothetical protein